MTGRQRRLTADVKAKEALRGDRTTREIGARHQVHPNQVSACMRLMGLAAIYRAPRTSAPHPERRVYPCLLKCLAIGRPDQVRCADIASIPVRRGVLYPVAIMALRRAQEAAAAAWTTPSSSGCGTRSHTRRSTCTSSPTAS